MCRRCSPRSHASGRQGNPVTAATLARIKATLRAALNAAIRAGYLTDNPACRPRPVVWTAARVREWERTGIRPPVAVWMPAQTAWFLNSIQHARLYAAYHLIALRGLRRGEAAGLRWCDVDLDGATAVICQQLQQYGGHLSACPPKTASSERVAPSTAPPSPCSTATAPPSKPNTRRGETVITTAGMCSPAWAVDPMAPDRLSRRFRQLSDQAGLPPVRLHDLRHGAATLALATGAAPGIRPYPGQRPPIPTWPDTCPQRHQPSSGSVGRLGLEPRTGGL
jgi:integrase